MSFDDLLHEVVEKGLCNRCGGCVSFCSAHRIGALEMGKENFPRYANKDECLECGICYLICPQTRVLNEEVREKFGWSAPIGVYQDVFSARTTNQNVLNVATDGGVVTSILLYMLENNLIHGAVVSRRTGLFNREPIVATSCAEIIEAAGSQFSESAHLEKIGTEYTTYVPMIPTIRKSAPKFLTRLAVVGTPCQISAVRKMQVLKILPSDVITFTIGLFCMQNFALDDLMRKQFAKQHRIKLEGISRVNIKEDLILKMDSGITLHIPLEEVETISRPACLACKEFANDYADISVGGLGSLDGYTTVLIRSIAGKKVYTGSVNKGYVENRVGRTAEENRAEKSRMLSLIETFVERKRKRGEKRLSEIQV